MNDFNTKETYLAARSEWRVEYIELSAEIRVARQNFNKSQQEFAKSVNKNAIAKSTTWIAVEKARTARGDLRDRANELLSELSAAKKEAYRQWLATRVMTM